MLQDKKADLIISTYVDSVLEQLCENLGVELLEYSEADDPTKWAEGEEWTIQPEWVKEIDGLFTAKVKNHRELTRKRKANDEERR